METLSSYQAVDARGHVLGPQIGGKPDPRFPAIVVSSIIGHLVFFAALMILSYWSLRSVRPQPPLAPDEKVTFLHISPSTPLRPPPELPERVDTRHLALDPHLDDTHLMERSPNPGLAYGTGRNQLPNDARNQSGHDNHDATAGSPRATVPQPPSSNPIQLGQTAQTDPATVSGLQTSKAGVPPPPPPGQNQRDALAESTGKKSEDSGAPRQLGYRALESQYRAYVRAKIYQENQRIMPKSFIESMLADQVSAEFAVQLTQGGRLKSVRLTRSCGYKALDDVARQAISLAAPFEGFPPESNDPMEIAVTVHYTPFK
ncbi:MAG TPA: TonB family protein [Blastocatellia bacterium]